VSMLNLGDDLGPAFPLKCINSQPRTGFKWLSLSNSSWAAGWCHLRCPLKVWKAARWECLPVTTSPRSRERATFLHIKWQVVTGKMLCSLCVPGPSLSGQPLGCAGPFLRWLCSWWEWLLLTQLSAFSSSSPRHLCLALTCQHVSTPV
jgi:hypothetical protein